MRPRFFAQAELVSDRLRSSLLPHCGECGLYQTCASPKMPVTGEGKRRVLVVAEAPGREEDRRGVQLIGEAGQLLRTSLRKIDIDLDRDCWKTNAVICRPPKNETPTDRQIQACRPNLLKTIRELDPVVIIVLGGVALQSLVGYLWGESPGAISRWAGFRIASQLPNAWICPTYHPSFLLRNRGRDDVAMVLFERHLGRAFRKRRRPWSNVPRYADSVNVIVSPTDAARLIRDQIGRTQVAAAFDFETTMINPDGQGAAIVAASICFSGEFTVAFPWQGVAVKAFREFVTSGIPKIAANLFMEDRWVRSVLDCKVTNWLYDVCIGAHVLDNRSEVSGLKFQSYVLCGQPIYDRHIRPLLHAKGGGSRVNRIDEIPLRDLLVYNGLDSLLTYEVAKRQRRELGWLDL